MAQKTQCPTHLCGLAQTIFLELKGTDGLTRQEIKNLLRTNYAHSSGMEVDGALDQLMGHTHDHKSRYLWCDSSGKYHVYAWEQNPVLRAHVLEVVKKYASTEGANYYDILKDLVQIKRLPQDHVLGSIQELKSEGLLIDEGGGRFFISSDVPESTIAKMISMIPTQHSGAR